VPRSRVTAYIGVGSSIDPERNLPAALRLLRARVDVAAVSSFYRTPALGRPDDPEFLNGAFRIETDLAPRALKYEVLRGIEAELGRERTGDSYAPRTIDLDLLLYSSEVVDEDGLRIPDPDIETRSFIAVPLAELDPELTLPDSGRKVSELFTGAVAGGLHRDAVVTRIMEEECNSG